MRQDEVGPDDLKAAAIQLWASGRGGAGVAFTADVLAFFRKHRAGRR
jgi:hypothetical protein